MGSAYTSSRIGQQQQIGHHPARLADQGADLLGQPRPSSAKNSNSACPAPDQARPDQLDRIPQLPHLELHSASRYLVRSSVVIYAPVRPVNASISVGP